MVPWAPVSRGRGGQTAALSMNAKSFCSHKAFGRRVEVFVSSLANRSAVWPAAGAVFWLVHVSLVLQVRSVHLLHVRKVSTYADDAAVNVHKCTLCDRNTVKFKTVRIPNPPGHAKRPQTVHDACMIAHLFK